MPRPTVADMICRMEGYNPVVNPLSRPVRNNNPGDLEYHEWQSTRYPGTMIEAAWGHSTPRFAHFPTLAVGQHALFDLLSTHYAGKTIRAALNVYAPATENNVSAYEDVVCKGTGLPYDHVINLSDCLLTIDPGAVHG